MKKFYKINATVWIYPGLAGWHFITLDKALSQEIKKVARSYGAGFVKIKATIGATSWQSALFPHKQSGAYLISIKTYVRKKEAIYEGDTVQIIFELV